MGVCHVYKMKGPIGIIENVILTMTHQTARDIINKNVKFSIKYKI